MTVYFIEIILLFCFYIIIGTNKINIISVNDRFVFNQGRKIFILLSFFILAAVAAFRDYSVGDDTLAYSLNFITISQFDSLLDLFDNVDNERGYLISQWIISKVGLEFRFVLILSSVLYIGAVSKLIYKYSTNPLMSYLIFMALGLYLFSFTALRQSIAMAICMIAYLYSLEYKRFKFVLLVLLASAFHISALIFMPSYFIGKLKFNFKNISFMISMAILFYLFSNQIFEILNLYSDKNYQEEETGGLIYSSLFYISSICGLYFIFNKIKNNEAVKHHYYMVISSMIVIPVAMYHPAAFRICYYYSIFIILYIPYLIKEMFNSRTMAVINWLIYSIMVVVFLSITASNPYFSNYLFMQM